MHPAEGSAGDPPALPRYERSDLFLCLFILGICAILYWDTTRWPDVPAVLAQNAPPTVFPRLLLAIIVVLSLFLPFERVWKRRAGIDLEFGDRRRPRPVVFLTAIVILLAVYLMPRLGALPVMIAAAAFIPILWGEKRYLIVAIFAVALPLGVALLFAYGLQVNLAFGLTGDLFR